MSFSSLVYYETKIPFTTDVPVVVNSPIPTEKHEVILTEEPVKTTEPMVSTSESELSIIATWHILLGLPFLLQVYPPFSCRSPQYISITKTPICVILLLMHHHHAI